MYVACVTIHVQPERVAEFIPAMLENARGTREEPGNLRYDVSQAEEDPAHFFLYEVYKDKDSFQAHQTTAHYLKWRDRVNGWMAERRQAVRFWTLFYGENETPAP